MAAPSVFCTEVHVGIGERVRGAWHALNGIAAAAAMPHTGRKTLALPSILSPYQRPGQQVIDADKTDKNG